jgi:hypothetical protein
MTTRVRRRRRHHRGAEDGAALVEFVLLGVVMMAPLMYLAVAVSAVQRNMYAVTQAAREAGRAYVTGTAGNAADRATYAARLALEDQGLPSDDVVLRYAGDHDDCAAASREPWPLIPGTDFAICVTRVMTLPGVPGLLSGSRNTVTGRFIVHADDYRNYGVRRDQPSGPQVGAKS